MAIVVKLTGDLSDLEAKLKSAGVKVESFGDDAETAGKQASQAFGSDLEQKIQRIEEATKRSADATETLASHAGGMNSLAEGFGNTERLVIGMNDVMGVAAEQFGVNLGPAQEYAQAIGDVAGGLEGVIGGGVALVQQLGPMVTGMVPVIASTWAHVTALLAQAAAMIAANLPIIAAVAAIALLAGGIVLLVKHWDEITEKIPFLGEAVDTIKTKLGEFGEWITGTFVPAVASLYDPAIKVPLELIVAYFKLQFDLVKVGIETVLGVIKGIVDIFMGVFTGDWDRAWAGVKAIVDSLWNGIKETFNLGVKFFTEDLLPRIKAAGSGLGGALKEGFVAGLRGLTELGATVANAVIDLLESALNKMVSMANAALPNRVGISVAGQDLGFDVPQFPSFSLPRLATGMWKVPGPAGVDQFPALLAGGEMVLPAGAAEAVRNSVFAPGATGGGGNTTITVRGLAGDGTGDPVDELARLLTLLAALDEQAREMWLANPENRLFMENLQRAVAGLPPVGSVGPAPSIYTVPSGPHPERGGGGLPTPTNPVLGGSGGASNGPPKTTPGGGVKADEEMVALTKAVLEELVKANRQRSNVLDVLKQPMAIDFMSRGDPKALANLLAPFLADALAQLYRRQWSPSAP